MSALRERRLVYALLVSALLVLGIFAITYLLLGRPAHGIDDADITMVYARNLARGAGYVYTVGGERVEGSSALLWTFVCAVLYRFVGDRAAWLFGTTAILTVGTVWLTCQLAARAATRREEHGIVVTLALLVASPSFFAWALGSLMDVALWSLTLTFGLAQALTPQTTNARRLLTATAGVLVALNRPEGLAVGPCLIVVAFAAARLRGQSTRGALTRIAPMAAAVVGAVVLVTCARLAYFGYPLPNTYYAKVGDDHLFTLKRGLHYLWTYFQFSPLHLLSGFGALWAVWSDGRMALAALRSRTALSEASVCRLGLAVMVMVPWVLTLVEGDDHFMGFRMLQPYAPFACALFGVQLVALLSVARRAVRVVVPLVVAAAGLFAWQRLVQVDLPRLKAAIEHAASMRSVGRYVEQRVLPGTPLPTIGTAAAGGIAYEYDGRVQDMLGLNWVAMAHATRDRRGVAGHAAFSEQVFWSDPPTLVSPGIFQRVFVDACEYYGLIGSWEDMLYRGLLSSERFRREYAAATVKVREGTLIFFARRDFLARGGLRGGVTLDWPADERTRKVCWPMPQREGA